ncbi:MAG: ABC transporter ATP-binding protein [Clostridia bacterium]|nr:ABC transporter ATP-binding protein [Clostridia bacterium]
MIELDSIVKKYEMGGETVYALNEVSLEIEQGEFVAIVGPSGSGKSTLMNIMGCLDIADKGSYVLDGLNIAEYSEKGLAQIRSRKIGFIFQGFNLLVKLDALENVELPLVYQGVKGKERRMRAIEALKKVGLSDRIHHKPTELSGGQQQRVAIARALVTQPSLILADEPTGNLDSSTGKQIITLFHELHKSGNTIVLITHDSNVAAEAECRVYIEDGRIKKKV